MGGKNPITSRLVFENQFHFLLYFLFSLKRCFQSQLKAESTSTRRFNRGASRQPPRNLQPTRSKRKRSGSLAAAADIRPIILRTSSAPRARCFSRRLSVPGRWMGLMNLPLIRHQRDRANCFLRRRSFPQEAEESVCGAAGSSTSEGGKVKIWQHGRRDRTPRSALRGWEEKTESGRGCSCKAPRSLSTVAPPGGPITPWPCTNFSCGMVR